MRMSPIDIAPQEASSIYSASSGLDVLHMFLLGGSRVHEAVLAWLSHTVLWHV